MSVRPGGEAVIDLISRPDFLGLQLYSAVFAKRFVLFPGARSYSVVAGRARRCGLLLYRGELLGVACSYVVVERRTGSLLLQRAVSARRESVKSVAVTLRVLGGV